MSQFEKVFLTEKETQVQALASVLGAKYDKRWYPAYTPDGKIAIVPLKGHVMKNLEPQEYDPALGQFGEGSIYVFPEQMRLKPDPASIDVLKRAVEHLKQAKKILIATDYDNEGAAIAMNVIRYAGCENKIEKMIPMGSTHELELKKAIEEPSSINYLNMEAAGKSRSFIDWAEGMSLSRALTYYLGGKGASKLNFGGVKTPIIYIVVTRDLAFESHQISYYWTATGQIQRADGTIINVKVKKQIEEEKKGKKVLKYTANFDTEAEAKKAVQTLLSQELEIEDFSEKKSKSSPPSLYELASLQIDMVKKYNVDLSGTMQIAQKLYDYPVSIQTYPRTETPYLKESEFVDVKAILSKLAEHNVVDSNIINKILSGNIPKRSSTFNDKEVVSHGAIVPTLGGDLGKWFNQLSDIERKEFVLIATRYVANFMQDYEYFHVSGKTKDIDGYTVEFSENVPINPGWREIYEPDINQRIAEFQREIPKDMKNGEKVRFLGDVINKNETKPKPRFKLDTLLSAIKTVANLFPDNEDIKEYLGAHGIGTNATRENIIKQLMDINFNKGEPWLVMKGKEIVSTQKARDLIKVLPEELVSPIKRALLSKELKAVEQGEKDMDTLVNEYRLDVQNNIAMIKKLYEEKGSIVPESNGNGLNKNRVSLGKCPVCKVGDIFELDKVFMCSEAKIEKQDGNFINHGCQYRILKMSLSRFGYPNISATDVKSLLKKGSFTGKFISKMNKPYEVPVIVDETYGVKADFDQLSNSSSSEKNYKKVGMCPLCGGDILAKEKLFQCEMSKTEKDSVGNFIETGCTYKIFRASFAKLGKPSLTDKEIETMFSKGSIEVTLTSTKTGKPFDAILSPDENGIKMDFKART